MNLRLGAGVVATLLVFSSLALFAYHDDGDDDGDHPVYGTTTPLEIASGGYHYLRNENGTLTAMPHAGRALAPQTASAVAAVPGWLRADLADQFKRLSELPLSLGECAAPAFVDLDADGYLDLFTGRADARSDYTGPGEAGVFIYYENRGTLNEPLFVRDTGTFPPYVTVGSYGAPAFADLDADGDFDLTVGDDDGKLVYFENTGTATEPVWGQKDPGVFAGIDVGENSVPAFADLDGDGDFDLTVGAGDGSLSYYRNTGSVSQPAWSADALMYALVFVEGYAAPAFGDLDGDGRLDLMVGDDAGKLFLFWNTGGVLGSVLWVLDESDVVRMDVGTRSNPVLVDLDGDGRLDLVVGAGDGNAYHYPNRGTSANPFFLSWNSGLVYDGQPAEISHPLEKNDLDVDRQLRARNEVFTDLYAELLLGAESRYRDEIGFSIAHTPVETLVEIAVDEATGALREPMVLLENAEAIYRADAALDYVRITENGVFYRDNASREVRMPDEIYYWYIVEPRMLFETPRYIHDDYWRTYFMEDEAYSDLTGGTLLEVAQSAATIYQAANRTTAWLANFMEFNYDDNYLQPITIYDNREGSCGEWSIIGTAAARTVLIPAWVVTNMGEDHQWNEFWFDGWHHWDITFAIGHPENSHRAIDRPYAYERNWGKDISGVYAWRGDDYSWGVSDHYTPVAGMTIVVTDRSGRPVDGARAVVSSHYFMENNPTYIPIPVPTLWNYTDADGTTRLEVGRNNYTLNIMSKIGNAVVELRDQDGGKLREGEEYTFEVTLDGLMPRPRSSQAGGGGSDSFTLTFDVVEGVARMPSTRSGNFHARCSASHVDIFVVDEVNFALFRANEHFEARLLIENTPGATVTVELNEGDYLVLSNRDTIETAKLVTLR